MKMYNERNKIKINRLLSVMILMVALLWLSGCGGNYGRLAVSSDVKQQFESHQVLSDHRYYYSGSVARPRAIIGIQEAYTLQSDLWVPIALTQERLKAWVDYFGPTTKYFQVNNGAEILTDDGKKIGVWYALVSWKDWAAVKMIDERVVNISAPVVTEEKGIFPWTYSNKRSD